jgi:hypothetical protein
MNDGWLMLMTNVLWLQTEPQPTRVCGQKRGTRGGGPLHGRQRQSSAKCHRR